MIKYIAVMLACMTLAACDDGKGLVGHLDAPNAWPQVSRDLVVYRDEGTGCDYVRVRGAGGGDLTPRLGADGKQICRLASQ